MRHHSPLLFMLVVGGLLRPGVSAAQDTPRFGVVMGYPAQVGVVWTIGDRFAIRPELNWTHTTTEATSIATIFNGTSVTTNTVTTTNESNAIGAGASALFYVATHDNLRTYLSPRFAYARTTISVAPPALASDLSPVNPTTTSYAVSGSLGAQYNMAKRFGIFGEIGLAFTRTTLSTGLTTVLPSNKSRSTGLRSGAGVILFFGS